MDPLAVLIASRLPASARRDFLADPEHFSRNFTRQQMRDAEDLLRLVRRVGQELLLYDAADYPAPLRLLADAPLLLYVAGDRSLLGQSARMAVVGSRRGTERGRWQAERLGRDLARAGIRVVSGLALGVDGESHRGALAAGGRCIGVVATGLDLAHPATHRQLHDEVRRTGLLISEYPPGTPPRKFAFVARNRILAGVASALVVVEAGDRSGALSTVDFALQMGLEVLCYPGPVDCVANRGNLRLLREGATLVRHAGDVLESLGYEDATGQGSTAMGMGGRPETAEEIARRLGRPLSAVLSELVQLEDAGRVRRGPGGRWRVTS